MFPTMLKTITRIPEKGIPWGSFQNAEHKFYSSINDKKRSTFGLISLLETHHSQHNIKNKPSKRGRLLALTAITLAGGVTLGYAKYDPEFRKTLTKYVSFVDPLVKTIFLEKDKPLPPKGIKSTIVGFIYGNKSNKSLQSIECNKDFSKHLKDYIPSFGTLPKTIKDGAGSILSGTYNGIKKPISSLFSGNNLPNPEVIQSNENKGVKNYIPSFGTLPKTIKDGAGSILSGTYSAIIWPISSLFSGNNGSEKYLTNQLTKFQNILWNINTNISKEEKLRLLWEWVETIDNIYYMIQTLNTSTSTIVLSQYSKHSQNLSKLIRSISKEEDYSRVIMILSAVTVISIQLFLIAYFNVAFTDQMANIAFSVYNIVKDDPMVRETLDCTIKKVGNYLPMSMLQSVDWAYYSNIMETAYSLFTYAAKYYKL